MMNSEKLQTSHSGELQYSGNIGPNVNGPGIKGDYDFLGAKTSVSAKSENDCNCVDIGIGAKLVLGIEINFKIGFKK